MNEAIRMQLSAFVDGELPDNEKDLLIRRLSQDADLRQQVAEFLAIGRAIRGDVQIGGVNALRERIAAELTNRPLDEADAEPAAPANRLLRPLRGIAIAASVALVAIVGLQQFSGTDPDVPNPGTLTTETEVFPTQPVADDILEQYRLLHNAGVSDIGANGIRTRLTVFELPRSDSERGDDDESPATAPDGDESPVSQPATAQ